MIKKGVKLELYRAFHNIGYVIALGVACAIAVAHIIMRILPESESLEIVGNMDYPPSVFNKCLMLDVGGNFAYLFYFGVILLGTLPSSISYFQDLRGGYIKNVCTRMDKRGYLIGKYIAIFVSAGSVCVIPLLLNLLLTCMFIPALLPQEGTRMFSLSSGCMLADLFYTHPFLYLGVYLLIDFVMVGLFTCLALAVSKFMFNQYLVLFTPFIAFLLLQTLLQFTYFNSAGPFFVMNPLQMTWQNSVIVITEIVLLFGLTFGIFYFSGGKKHDVL